LTLPVFTSFVGAGKVAMKLLAPTEHTGSTFLTTANLRNIASQIAVIAILAIGMTMVIITAGIDLSVGSLIALSAVVSTFLIQSMGGAAGAGTGALIIASLLGIAACSLVGGFTGWMVSGFCVPPFIATLAMMQVVRGGAYKIADNQTISDIPASYQWLGNGLSFGIPNCVILMLILYVIAHLVMSKTQLGRYIYATGGNPEAARLSGISPKRIKLTVYIIAGALAGLGGVVLASQLQSGAGRYGETYELKVIAAVVVGGTSLFGGRGKIFGTLIGAFIIAVIENGMNLKRLGSETQMIVLGAVILLAVLLERIRSGEWKSATGG
jgi:ribose transport system permease protein